MEKHDEILNINNALNMNKTSSEPKIYLDTDEQKENDIKYLSYVEEIHNKINSHRFEGPEPEDNDYPSEKYSENRLKSSSSENIESLRKFEDNNGELYLMMDGAEGLTVKIPQLNLGNIIQKQERKMYPFNINSLGELVELTNKESSLETHNDEDAIIIYDEQDQEEDIDPLLPEGEDHKHSNLFNSSFFSDLSSVHQSHNKKEVEIEGEKDFNDFNDIEGRKEIEKVILVKDNESFSHHNSFLNQELNIESIPFEDGIIDVRDHTLSIIDNEEQKSSKNILEDVLGLFSDETGRFNYEDEKSPIKEGKEIKNNNYMEKSNSDNITDLAKQA